MASTSNKQRYQDKSEMTADVAETGVAGEE